MVQDIRQKDITDDLALNLGVKDHKFPTHRQIAGNLEAEYGVIIFPVYNLGTK